MKQILHRFRGWTTSKRHLKGQSRKQYILPLVVIVGLTVFAQSSPTFADPDAYYHARISAEMWDQGIQYALPALPFSSWGEHFTDQHLLYHLLIAPLAAYLDPLVAIKLVHVALVALLVVGVMWFMRRLHLPYVGIATTLLFLVSPFFTRLQLIKATPLALLLFVITLAAVSLRRPWLVFCVSWIYVYAHGGYILAIAIAGVFWLGHTIGNSIAAQRVRISSPLYILASMLGITLGVVINPYFPANLQFMWEQLVQIGVVNYSSVISVGAEWYAYRPSDLAQGISVLLVFTVMACSIIVIQRYKRARDGWLWSMGVFILFLLIMTLRSRRYVEYLVPVIGFTVAYVVLPYIQNGAWKTAWVKLGNTLGKWRGVIFAYIVVMMLLSVGYQTTLNLRSVRTSSLTWATYQEPMQQLAESVPHGTQIFHVRWDAFPQMYYPAPNLRYMAGLDATFFYRYDTQLYQAWDSVGKGEVKQPARYIRDTFKASYVVIQKHDSKQRLLDAWLLRDANAEVIIETNDIRIYHLL